MWLGGFKTEFPLMVPIQIFSKLSVSQLNLHLWRQFNSLLSDDYMQDEFKTEFALMVHFFQFSLFCNDIKVTSCTYGANLKRMNLNKL